MSASTMGGARRRAHGFSIVELMVAIALGGILLAGAASLFISNREAYNVTTDMSRLQESARFALEMMVRDIRMAGFFGCSNNMARVVDQVGASATDPGALWDPTNPMEGLDDFVGGESWSPSAADPPADTLAGTDLITLRYLSPTVPDHVVSDATDSTVTVANAAEFAVDWVAGVGDCGGSDVFQVVDVTGNEIEANNLSRTYQADSTPVAAPLVAVRYYVANNAEGIPTLYRRTINVVGGNLVEQVQELFEGVADMQILYGVNQDADAEPDAYLNAGDAGLSTTDEWRRVVAVRIGLLMRSPVAVGQPITQTFPVGLLDKAVGPFNDGFRRRVFVTTAQVRNLK